MSDQQKQLRLLLNRMEEEIRATDLWEAQPPSDAALASAEPFCVDTLSLVQWLQWLLIPRMHALLDGGYSLPGECNIHAIAEESFKDLEPDCSRLLTIIAEFDNTLSAN